MFFDRNVSTTPSDEYHPMTSTTTSILGLLSWNEIMPDHQKEKRAPKGPRFPPLEPLCGPVVAQASLRISGSLP
jgi:hypothetical protein